MTQRASMNDLRRNVRASMGCASLALASLLMLASCDKSDSSAAPASAPAPAASASAAAGPLKVAFVYVGPVGDAGWTFAHDRARKEAEESFGGKVQTSFVENVPAAADAERVLRDEI